MSVYARADYQAISPVPGCDEEHRRPADPRTGLPVPVWELTCEAHERWICGEGKQKVIEWERDGNGFRMLKVQPMGAPGWAKSIDAIPLTPDQIRAETRRSALTRRAEQAMLMEGVQNTRLALEYRPTARELLRARALAGRGTIQMAVCHACQATYLIGAVYCPQCAVRVGTAPAEAAADVEPEPAAESAEA